jgi:hypothetical protein
MPLMMGLGRSGLLERYFTVNNYAINATQPTRLSHCSPVLGASRGATVETTVTKSADLSFVIEDIA